MDTIQFNKVEIKYHIPVSSIQLIDLMRCQQLELINGVVLVGYDGDNCNLEIIMDATKDITHVQNSVIDVILNVIYKRR